MIQQTWPNKLGIDVLDDQGNELGEVWQSRLDGKWGIRTFKDGAADRSLLIDPSEHLFMTPFDAVAICQATGDMIE